MQFTEVPYKGNPWAVFPIGGIEHPEVLKNAEHFVELSVDERRQFGGKREVAATRDSSAPAQRAATRPPAAAPGLT